MADMQRPPEGAPPQGGQDPMSANRSPFHPADAAFMKKSGQMSADMSFGQFMESSFGIKWEEPLQTAVQKMQKNVQNADPIKKMQNIAGSPGGAPPGPQQGAQKPMPQGRKPMVQSGGLEGIMSQMGQ